MRHETSGGIGLIHKGLAGALVTAGASIIVLLFLRALGGLALPVEMYLLLVIGAAIIGGMVQRMVVGGAAAAVESTLVADGSTTRYVPTFSHIEALEIRGDLVGAEKAWDEACAEDPTNAFVLVKAAEFHLRLKKDPAAALPRYRQVRDLPGASAELVRYSAQKVIDLYLGPLADEGRALVELRRMVERFPGTREAADARDVIARLKAARPRD